MSREFEWQFDAVDLRPVAAWLDEAGVEPASPQSIVDVYADTSDWRLYRSGWSLRVRALDDGAEATLKSMPGAVDGVRDRTETAESLPSADPGAVLGAPGVVGERVRALAGARSLRRLFEVRTSRQRFDVVVGEARAEVALDDTEIPVPGGARAARLQRVEVELVAGSPDELAPFVDALRHECSLRPAIHTKFEAGLVVTRLLPRSLPDLGGTDVRDDMTIGEVAFASMRRRFADLLRYESGVRVGEDPEAVHDMRVASRRLRAALALFAPYVPARGVRLGAELKWVADALGEVRDLDVQLLQLQAWGHELSAQEEKWLLDPVRAIEDRRESARARLLRVLDSSRFERMVASLTSMLQQGPARGGPAALPVVAVAPALIRERHKKVRRAGDRLNEHSHPADLHRLRIRGKRLRYALEFLEPVYPSGSRRLIRRLTEVQDVLGAHQDAQVAMVSLRDLAEDPTVELPSGSVFLLGRLADRYERLAAGERARFSRAYRRIRGGVWKRLRHEMESKVP
jgi:CHAD domain-containing protein